MHSFLADAATVKVDAKRALAWLDQEEHQISADDDPKEVNFLQPSLFRAARKREMANRNLTVSNASGACIRQWHTILGSNRSRGSEEIREEINAAISLPTAEGLQQLLG